MMIEFMAGTSDGNSLWETFILTFDFYFFLVLVTPDNEDIYDVTHGYIVTLVFECHARYLCYK